LLHQSFHVFFLFFLLVLPFARRPIGLLFDPLGVAVRQVVQVGLGEAPAPEEGMTQESKEIEEEE